MALIFCFTYPLLVGQVYRRAYPSANEVFAQKEQANDKVVTAARDVVPKKAALIYAVLMSLFTLVPAGLTAYY
jgi:hypothetical protein